LQKLPRRVGKTLNLKEKAPAEMWGFSFCAGGPPGAEKIVAAASGWKKIMSRLVAEGKLPGSWEAEIMFSLHNEFFIKLSAE
jgi:hypothetical protein